MKRVKQISLIVLAMLLLAACGGLPTDGLTASMGTDQTESSEQDAPIDVLELAVTECSGEWNPENNMLRVSFQLETDEDVFGTDAEALRLFGGGTMLMGDASAEPSGNYRLRCEGPAEMAVIPLQTNGEVVGLTASIKAADLLFEFPSGETTTLENVPIRGLLAPSAADIPEMIGAVHGLNPDNVSYQSFFAGQKALHLNYPDAAFVREAAQNNGLSARNAARLGELYVEQDIERQQALLIDMLTSPEDEEYAEAVVGATVKTLAAMGLDFQTISNLFEQETDGRVAVQFKAGADLAATSDLDVQISNRDGVDSAVFTASAQGDSGSGENGGGTGSEGGGTDGGSTDGGTDGGGTDGGGTGNEGGGTGGEGGGTDGGNGGGRTIGGFLRDFLWNVLHGTAAGATVGGTMGTAFGPEGTVAGAGIGAGIGAIGGGVYTITGGVYDHAPNDPNSPCKSPIVFC